MLHRITQVWSNGAISITKTFDLSAGAEHNIDEAIAAGAVHAPLAFVLDVSQCKALVITADQPLTLKTNSSGAPANTITLAADRPFLWTDGMPAMRDSAGTVVVDVTSLFVSNPGAVATTLQIRALIDPTI